MSPLIPALTAIGLALFFNFSNGFHDASNIVATMVSSRAMKVRPALVMTAIFVFMGSFFLGTAVAETIGHGLLNTRAIDMNVVIAATSSAIAWNILTWFLGLPSSSSHALIGGMTGAALIHAGPDSIQWTTLGEVIAIIFISPLVGFAVSYLVTQLNFHLFRNMRPSRAGRMLTVLQILSGALLALAHGTNDAQKAMGLIMLTLAILHADAPGLHVPDSSFEIPLWVVLTCSIAISAGMLSGGKRIIKTVGMRLYKIRPMHGFGSQLSSAVLVYACAALGFPVSTTQIAASSIMGAGAAQRMSIVRWGIAGNILVAWFITIPATFAMGCFLCTILKGFG